MCVCVYVQAAPEVRMQSGRISFQSPVPSFNVHTQNILSSSDSVYGTIRREKVREACVCERERVKAQ